MFGSLLKMRIRFLAVYFFLSIPIVCAAEDELDLQAFLSQVSEANPAIQAAQSRHSALQNRIKPAASLDDPFIAAGIDEVPFGEHRAQVFRYQISQAIPFPGKLSAREAIAKHRAEFAEQGTETLRRELTVIATQFFYKAHYIDEAIALNRELRRLVDNSVLSAKANYQSGGTDHHDWLLGKIEAANLDVEHSKLSREQNSIRALMNELRGRAPDELIGRMVVRPPADSINAERNIDLKNQPELKALDYQYEQAESEYKLAKLAYYPDFVVQAMAMEPNGGGMDATPSNWGIMVGVNVPLYFSRKQSKLAAAAQDEQRAVEMDRRYLTNKLNTEIVNARQQLASAKDVVRLYESDVIPATELALSDAKSAYAAQRLELKRYLDILKIYQTQKLELVAAQADIELARTRLKELLSSPPLMKIAPSRPSLFGGSDMGGTMEGPDPVSMGGGMTAGKNVKKNTSAPTSGGSAGMGGM
jgi:outer membrane protein TolC